MLLAVIVAVLAVALGAALTAASGARPGVLGLLRTFAATAAAAVVVTHLLPDALRSAGLWGGLVFLLGLLGPLLLHPLTESLARRRSDLSPRRVALEAGFVGLLVHHVGDGLGIGAYAAMPGGVFANVDVVLALVAHTVPLVAVVTLAYRAEYGTGAAWQRAGALALASALGVLLSFAVPAAVLAAASGWVGAIVSGVLLHVVTHDWLEDVPAAELPRVLDVLAALAGLSLVLLSPHEKDEIGSTFRLWHHVVLAAERSAPFLLLGLLASFLLADKVHAELDRLGSSLLVRLGSRLGFALGPEGIALGLGTYGVAWTLAALLSTTLVPLVAATVALLAVAIAGEEAAKDAAERAERPAPRRPRPLERFDRATAIWVVALAMAAVFQVALPEGELLGSSAAPSELSFSALIGALVGSGGPSVVALGALTDKGLSPGAALLGATLSSALGLTALRQLWERCGGRALFPALIWLVCLTAAVAIGINQVAPIARPILLPVNVGRVGAALLALLIVVRAQRVGVRRWLAGWFVATRGEAHHHAGHDHTH